MERVDSVADGRKIVRNHSIATFACMALALTCILVLGIWGAVRDLHRDRDELFRSEIAEMRSHAERTVRDIELCLLEGKTAPNFSGLRQESWLVAHWKSDILAAEKCAYAAIEDQGHTVVAHSNAALEGNRLPNGWYERVVPVAGSDVVETRVPELTECRPAFDLRLPIMFNSSAVGIYHAGMSVDWFERAAVAQRGEVLFGWTVVVGGVVLVVLSATASLCVITRHAAGLQHRLDRADLRRVTELGQFVVGLAHEVRNPLNAIRLNLHAIDRVHRGEASLPDQEISSIVRESVREISRISALISEMLGYARSEPARDEVVDLNTEVHGALDLVKHAMEDHHVAVVARMAAEPRYVRIDRARLRQVLLNLLNNAREAVGKGGRIEISVDRSARIVELTVSDNGPGVPAAHRHRVFEPFYSTKELGIGLGLALVKKFIDEGGGTISYDAGQASGGCFVVRLPEACTAVTQEVIS